MALYREHNISILGRSYNPRFNKGKQQERRKWSLVKGTRSKHAVSQKNNDCQFIGVSHLTHPESVSSKKNGGRTFWRGFCLGEWVPL